MTTPTLPTPPESPFVTELMLALRDDASLEFLRLLDAQTPHDEIMRHINKTVEIGDECRRRLNLTIEEQLAAAKRTTDQISPKKRV